MFRVLFFLMAMAFMNTLNAQKQLIKQISLQMPGDKGRNAGAVAWHPHFKQYYTSMIGNTSYEMAVFNERGKLIEGGFAAGEDLRGLWYNTQSKKIEFNLYNNAGVGFYFLNEDGKIVNIEKTETGNLVPFAQSVATYNFKDSLYIFPTDNFELQLYSKLADGVATFIKLYLGCSSQDQKENIDADAIEKGIADRNPSVQYTGILKKEFAVLNHVERKLEFYDKATGLLTDIIRIPNYFSEALQPSFNFCYAHELWWFFNVETRSWSGYKY